MLVRWDPSKSNHGTQTVLGANQYGMLFNDVCEIMLRIWHMYRKNMNFQNAIYPFRHPCKYGFFVFNNSYYCNLFMLNHGGMFIYKLFASFILRFNIKCIFISIYIVIHVHICECWNTIIELNWIENWIDLNQMDPETWIFLVTPVSEINNQLMYIRSLLFLSIFWLCEMCYVSLFTKRKRLHNSDSDVHVPDSMD